MQRKEEALSLSLSLPLLRLPSSKKSQKHHHHLHHHSKHQTKTTPTSVNQIPINPNSPIVPHSPKNTRNQPQTAQPVPDFAESEKEPNGPLNCIFGSHHLYHRFRIEKTHRPVFSKPQKRPTVASRAAQSHDAPPLDSSGCAAVSRHPRSLRPPTV